jgi:hypothetical protein
MEEQKLALDFGSGIRVLENWWSEIGCLDYMALKIVMIEPPQGKELWKFVAHSPKITNYIIT